MAARGVWPLLVRPSVDRMIEMLLRNARVKRVRLDTYRAEFLGSSAVLTVTLEDVAHAAVKAEKRKQASRKPGRVLMPAFSMAITKGERDAVTMPSSRDSR